MTLPQPLRQLALQLLSLSRLKPATEWPQLPALSSLIAAIANPSAATPPRVHLHDEHSNTLDVIASHFPAESILLPAQGDEPLQIDPADVVILGPRQLPPDRRFDDLATRAHTLLCIATHEEFRSGLVRFDRLMDSAAQHDLEAQALAYEPCPSAFVPDASRMAVLLCKSGSPAARRARGYTRSARYAAIARALLTPGMADPFSLRIFASRSDAAFPVGISHPGVVDSAEDIFVIADAERIPRPQQTISRQLLFTGAQPVLLKLNAALNPAEQNPLAVIHPPDPTVHRLEKFRLFASGERIFCSHSVVTLPPGPILRERTRVATGLGELFPLKTEMHFLGFPRCDRPAGHNADHWALLTHEDGLFLIRSPRPWTLFHADSGNPLAFIFQSQTTCALPYLDPSIPVHNSIHPVLYSDNAFLHVIHQEFQGQQCAFWGLLIDRQSLLPTAMTARPIVRAGTFPGAGAVEISSALPLHDRVHFFCSINGNACAVATVSRRALDDSLRELPPLPSPTAQ